MVVAGPSEQGTGAVETEKKKEMSWGWYTITSSSVGVPLMVLFDTLGNLLP